MRARILRHKWEPMSCPRGPRIQMVMSVGLESWRGTPYHSGQRCKGAGADCIGFVFGVIDELDGRARAADPTLPHDVALHSPGSAFKAVAAMRRLYSPAERLRNPKTLQPGDLLIVGTSLGGPGHLMIVGPRRNTIWHATPSGAVHQSGWMLADGYQRLYAVYRLKDRGDWAK